MKKIITLASILAVSGFAFANAQTDTQPAQPTDSQQQMVFGAAQDGKKHERKHERRNGEHKGEFDRKEHGAPMAERGGFIDESTMLKNLNDAANGTDNARFMIEGNIIKQVGKKDFIFKDNAGTEHQIEVSRHAWHGATVTPNDKIKIEGKVDKDWGKTELEVKNITKF